MYESVIDLVSGQATMLFVELQYTLATEEAERIGVDHVARMSNNESGENSLGKRLVDNRNHPDKCESDSHTEDTVTNTYIIIVL